jgi:peptidoglycan/xylan/chitin deacetylase (PgdA/CDA1 family)
VVVTFDDGYKDNYTNAYPILKKYGLPATIFLTADSIGTDKLPWWDKVAYIVKQTGKEKVELESNGKIHKFVLAGSGEKKKACKEIIELMKTVEDYEKDNLMKALQDYCTDVTSDDLSGQTFMLSWEEVQEMSNNGIEFGAHSCTHPILPNLQLNEMREEVIASKKKIEDKLSKTVEFFAYPNGNYNVMCREIVEESGFLGACSYQYGTNNLKIDIYTLKRIAVNYEDHLNMFMAKLILPKLMGIQRRREGSKKSVNWFLIGGLKTSIEVYLQQNRDHLKKAKILNSFLKIPPMFFPTKLIFRLLEKNNPQVKALSVSMYPSVRKFILDNWNQIYPESRKPPADLSCLIRERMRNIYFYISTKNQNLLFIKHIKYKKMAYLIEDEYNNTKYLQKRLKGSIRKSIPELCLLEKIDGCHQVMILNYITGEQMSETLSMSKLDNVLKIEKRIMKILKWLVEFQKQTEVSKIRICSLESRVESLLSAYVNICPDSNVGTFFNDHIMNKIREMNDVEIPLVCSHGDFFPSNILMNNGYMTVIDWADMEKEDLPTNDIFAFFLSYRFLNRNYKRSEILLKSFETVFFDGSEFSSVTKRCLDWYAAEMGFGRDVLSLMFPVYLLKQALYESQGIFENQGKRLQKWTERLRIYVKNR